jgi:hypothetical protein
MKNKCNAVSRRAMCKEVREYVDGKLEELSLLHASHGTKSKHDAGSRESLREKEVILLMEIEKVAPEYFKVISDK